MFIRNIHSYEDSQIRKSFVTKEKKSKSLNISNFRKFQKKNPLKIIIEKESRFSYISKNHIKIP